MVIEATNKQNSEQTLLTTRFSHSSVVDHSSLVIPFWKSKLFRGRPWYFPLFIYLYSHSHKVIADQIFAQLSLNVLREVNTRAGVFYQGQIMCNVTLTHKSVNNVWCSKRATCRFSEKILVIYIKLPYMYFQNSKLLADTLAFITCSSTLLWSVGGPSVLRSFRRVWLKARIDLTFTFHVSHFSNLFFLSESYCATRNSSLQIVTIKHAVLSLVGKVQVTDCYNFFQQQSWKRINQ